MIKRAKGIRLLVMDVDGILTDGRVTYTAGGQVQMSFDIRDGLGIQLARRCGLFLAIISGRESAAVAQRARELGIPELHQGASDKLPVLEALLHRHAVLPSQAAAMGDDLTDLPVLSRVGLAITVPGAVDEVLAVAHYVTQRPGGLGAVREAIELVLRSQGHWPMVLEHYQQ